MKKAILIMVLGLLWSNIVFADSKKPIVIPTHNWSSQVVMAYVIGGIFEAMGNNVKYVPADSQAVYESIRRGDVSISHEVWQSAFGKSFDNAMDKGGIIDAGAHVARTLEDMGVPNWVIEKELCPGLPNWEALKNSDCARNFKQSGGKGVWLEGPQSWHGDLIPQRLEALGLGDLWKVKFAGGADALWAELAAAKREGRGTIIFNWTPNFTDMEGFTMIKFPPYYNGCRPADGGDGRCGSPDGYLKKAASSKFAKNHPNAFKAFKKINFTTLDIGTMAGYVDVDKMTHEAAAKKWLRDNRHKWKYWIGRSNVVYDAVKQQRIDQKYPRIKTAKKEQSQTTDIKIFKKVTTELAGGQGRRFHGHTWKGYVVSKEYYCQEALKAGMPNWGNELYTKKGCYESSKTKIVKKTTQEEFKPEDEDIDNDPPIIEIAEAITVNDSNYEIEGKVSDKGSDKIYVKVDGRNVVVKKGKFKIKRYSPVDEQIEIVAIDQWGNESKPKLVNITIDIQETVVVEKLEPLNPSKIRSKSSNNKVALIIGIENYAESPKATYANLDAKYFFDYARKAFGVKKQNIKLLIDEDATYVKTNVALTKWLRIKIKPDQTDLIVFFAGHGLASNDGKELYLLPQDSDPNLLDITALSRTKLFQTIVDLKPKSVTMFLDTCYSGVSRDEQMLLASARPIRIVADEQEGIPDNFTIFSATELDQISSGLKEAKHGIFSYYLMKGLEGKADSNKDYKITNGELLAYMDLNVSQKAAELGRQQNPSLAGNPDQVLMSYR